MDIYKISSIERIEAYEEGSNAVLVIHLKETKLVVTANYIEFNYPNDTFTVNDKY